MIAKRTNHARPIQHVLAVVAVAGLLPGCAPAARPPERTGTPPIASASTSGITISGQVFYDRNDDGIRQQGEPGVAGVRVRHAGANAATITDSNGGYVQRGLPDHGKVTVESGWFRSQCPAPADPQALSCPAGPGADNDFAVDNQYIQYPVSGPGDHTGVDVGLLPDWPGGSLLPPPAIGGVVPANPVDVAARLSWASSTCTDGAYTICRPADRFTLAAQIYNQGTTALTGVTAKVLIPAGDCLTAVALVPAATAPAITAARTTPAASGITCRTRVVEVALTGALLPAAAARLALRGVTRTGPGTPGCLVHHPDPHRCETREPQARGWLFAVSHIDQPGDPDSTFCAAGDIAACPTGMHDKRRSPDEVDPAGHNVSDSLPAAEDVDLHAGLALLPRTPVQLTNHQATVRAWITNDATGTPLAPGAAVTVRLPPGTAITGPPPTHHLLACQTSAARTGSVTCHYHGPIPAGMSSMAADVTVALPSGTDRSVVACAAPVPTQRRTATGCEPGDPNRAALTLPTG